MSWPSDQGSLLPLLALVISVTLLVTSLSTSPGVFVLQRLRAQEERLRSSRSLLQAVGRVAAMSYAELQGERLLRVAGDPPVEVRLTPDAEGVIAASFFIQGESSASLNLYLVAPRRRGP